jgi:hypothetical protein
MNQNSFCTKCHRIPSQCVCGNTQRELTDEEIISEWIGNDRNYYNFARAILRKASEK